MPMGTIPALAIWLFGGPLLLLGFALRFPIWFCLTAATSFGLAFLVSRRLTELKFMAAFGGIGYTALLAQWFVATQLWHL